jgi:hypothetical protein
MASAMEKAKELVAKINDNLYGNDPYRTSLSCHFKDPSHIDEVIELIKLAVVLSPVAIKVTKKNDNCVIISWAQDPMGYNKMLIVMC